MMAPKSSMLITYFFGFWRPTPEKMTWVVLMTTCSPGWWGGVRASARRSERASRRSDGHLLIVHVEHRHGSIEPHRKLDEEMHRCLALRPHDGAADGGLVHLGLPHQAEHRARLIAQHCYYVPGLRADRVIAVAKKVERTARRVPPVPLRRVRNASFERRRVHLVLAALDALQQCHGLRLAAALADRLGQ